LFGSLGGPAHKESGSKPSSLQAFKLDSPQALGYYRIMNKKEITEKIFNEHMKNKLRPEWRSFSKWKKKFKHCYAYFSNNKLFHVGK